MTDNYPLPASSTPSLPQAFEGKIFENVGKYARQSVMYAFQRLGGPDGLADWATDNREEFYTKLFPKIIARESEVTHKRDIDTLMDLIDGEYEVAREDAVEDAEVLPPAHDKGGADIGAWDIDDLVEFEG